MTSSPASRKASTTPADLGSLPTTKELRVQFKKWFPRDDEPRTLEQLRGLSLEQLADPKLGPTLEEYRMLFPRDGTKWTDQETEALYSWRLNSENVPYAEIGRRLHRSVLACRLRVHNLRDGRVKGFEHYDTSVLANRFGRRRLRGGASAARSQALVSASRQRTTDRTMALAPPMTQPGPTQPQPAQSAVPSAAQSGFRPINQHGQDNADPTETAHALISLSQGVIDNRSSQDQISIALAINKAARSDTPQHQPEDFSKPTSHHTGAAEPAATPQRTATFMINERTQPGSSPQSPHSPQTTEGEAKEDSSAPESKPVHQPMSLAHIMNSD